MEEIRAGGMQLYYDNIENCNTEYFEQYFHYIKEHFYEFRILFSANYVSGFTLRFSKVICKNRLKTRQQWYGNSKEEPDQFSTFIAYREEILSALYISLFSVWVNRNMDLSEKQMGRMLLELWRPLNALF